MNCTLGVQCFTCPCPYFLHPVSSFICLASHDKESELCSKNKIVMVVLLRTGTLKEQGWHSAPERQVTLPIRFLKKLSLADVMNCAHSLLSFTSFYFTGSFTF
ncbi:uncharacterized protein LOC131034833 isoform X2 [Cryptomeria japonica]|uniref:uncharacterized protein LOC131034833 isoform X2 n=1 Tax=Cryptomeria japonica TaxID=3369 RepID=UPI0027DA62FC|nr:uncharacterized protein LOC131034833 isoform X2 [Cryptomeria japonica]